MISGKRGVLVIGASSPIGQAIGQRFTAVGDIVVGVSRSPVIAVDDTDWGFAESHDLDAATSDGAAAAVAATIAAAGRLDVVVLAAAFMPVAPLTATSDEQWQAALTATMGTAFAVSRAALPHLGADSAIVAITSVNATLAAPGVPAYAAAKSGVEGLVRQLALEYGPQGVRVNAVAPGMILAEHQTGPADAAAGYPLGRVGRPAEVAEAVHFLAGAGFITGVTLPVDGGLSISSPAAFLRADLRDRWL